MIEQIQIYPDWTEFATAKKWKQQLTIKSHSGELSKSTWDNARYWMPFLLKVSEKTPDELIEEALSDNEQGELRLQECFRLAKKRGVSKRKNDSFRPVSHNSAITGVYGILRGFYSHNKIVTQGWHTPNILPRAVEQSDANFPLFISKDRKLDLNRELLQGFFEKLNSRDRTIALCLISTGMDDGDLLNLDVDFVKNQDSREKRLFLSTFRSKTSETVRVFFSKEATKKLRVYVRNERKDAKGEDPLFVTTMHERKRKFKIKYPEKTFTNSDYDLLPEARQLTNNALSQNFKNTAESMGVKVPKSQQSPLRPKRLRHVFRTACQLAGLSDDLARVFMGQKSQSSKIYSPKSREELELFYESVEPFVSVFIERIDEDEFTKLKIEQEKKVQELNIKITELKDDKTKSDDLTKNLMMSLLDDAGIKDKMVKALLDSGKFKKIDDDKK